MGCTRSLLATLFLGFVLTAGPQSEASLSTAFDAEGRIGWSIDGTQAGSSVAVVVPPGSTVERAFLYTHEALHTEQPAGVAPTVQLAGVTYEAADFLPLTFVQFPAPFSTGMQAFRADATEQLAALVGNGSEDPFFLPVLLHDFPAGPRPRPPGASMLVVIYRNPLEPRRQIVILDGGTDPAGDAFTFELSRPASAAATLLSLGIGFSSGSGVQKTLVDVDGRRLTSIAGGIDDPGLTVGGYLDSTSNPSDPFASPTSAGRLDDELYDLALGNLLDPNPFVRAGTEEIRLDTVNPSLDDNLFFAAISVVQLPVVIEIPAVSSQSAALLALLLMLAGVTVLVRRFSD